MTNVEVPKQKSETQPVPVLAALWQSRMKTLFGVVGKPLTPRDFGQLKKLRTCLGGVTSELIDWALNNWGSFATKAAAEAGIGVWPAHPHIGFLLAHHALALELQSIAKAPVVAVNDTPVKAAKPIATFSGEKNIAKEKAFKPTPAQVAKIMAAMQTDGDLDQVWAEIELENKDKLDACEEVHGLTE